MPTRRRIIIGAGAVAVAAATGAGAWIALRDDAGTHAFFAVDGIAIRGTDPVAYFTEAEAIAGSAEYTAEWSGVTWQFASAENRDAFVAEPTAYAPQYGGYCAWAVAAKEELYSTQPENWSIVDGKLYLNYSDGVQADWNEDRPGFIATGDANWPRVREVLSPDT